MSVGCRFCAEIVNQGSPEPWNVPLFESENFAVVPSIGSFIEGWLLFLPKSHHLSCATLDRALLAELDLFRHSVCNRLSARFGEYSFFEHGPICEGDSAGCTIDHAHLHAVPTLCDLLAGAEQLLELPWEVTNGLAGVKEKLLHQPYLYVEQKGRSYAAFAEDLPSQFFRRVLSQYLGIREEFDWREYPQLEVVRSTIAAAAEKQEAANFFLSHTKLLHT